MIAVWARTELLQQLFHKILTLNMMSIEMLKAASALLVFKRYGCYEDNPLKSY